MLNVSKSSPHLVPVKQRGVSLLESLVALLVLALGVLGLLGTQLKSLSDNRNATQRILATRMADDLFERIKANSQGLKNLGGVRGLDFYNRNSSWTAIATPAQNCVTNACNPQDQATYDLWRWHTGVTNTLPGGNATTFIVAGTDPDQLGVMISWPLRNTDGSSTAAETERASWLNVDVAGGPACPTNPASICHVAYGKP
jgi:type IV pilus assembly protein PilV